LFYSFNSKGIRIKEDHKMTQVNKTATPTAREQHAATVAFRSSLESLMVVGQALLAKPSMEDSDAVAYTTLTEDVLEPAGLDEEMAKIDGVTDPAAKVELIMQDILQPQLSTVAKLEEHLATKAEGQIDTPFTTRDQMTAGPSLESLEQQAAEITVYHSGLGALKTMASMEGITVDNLRPMAVHFIKQVPAITDALSISVEDLEATQVLGDLTDAVDRITQVVDNAREVAETKVSDARSEADQATGADDGSDLGTKLAEKARGEDASGVKVDEGVKVSTTTNEGNAEPAAGSEGGAATDPTDPDAVIDADAAAAGAAAGDDEPVDPALAEAEAAAAVAGDGDQVVVEEPVVEEVAATGSGDDSTPPAENPDATDGDDDVLSEPGAFTIEKTDAEKEAEAKEKEEEEKKLKEEEEP
jgi:hypothetical protein